MIITIRLSNKDIDIKMDERQTISMVMAVLQEKGVICLSDSYTATSVRENKLIDIEKKLIENGITNGDIVLIECND